MTHSHTSGTTRRGLSMSILGLTLAAAALTGCAGHGSNTAQQMTLAQQRMAQIKSATEWEMAEQAHSVGDLDRALEKVENSLGMNPSVAKSHVLRGRILLEQGELEKARISLLRAEVINPDFVDAHYYLAVVNERLAKKDEALARYLRAVELAPDQALYAVAAAELMIDLDRSHDAEAFLADRSGLFAHNAGVRQTRGHLAMIHDDPARAAELFREARLLAPEDTSMLEDLVVAQMELGEFAEAEFGLAQLLRLEGNEDRRDLLRMRARCMLELDRTLEARETLISLTEGEGGDVDLASWLDLGALAYRTNDLTRLRQAGSKIVSISPRRPEGHVYRAIWFRKQGDDRKALEALDAGFRSAEMPVDAFLLRGVIEQEMGMSAAAERSFAAAHEMDPDDERAALLMGLLDQPTGGVASFPVDDE
ncbi:MAG: tetratricopeptide repeat protein [Planctomycetota bacterium]